MALKTLAEFTTEEILPIIPNKTHKFKIGKHETRVKTCSLRLKVFKQNLSCVSCGITGSVFKLQNQDNENPHLNLYSNKDGKWILMTKDHIRPKSKGGKDRLSNLCTMCYICNEKKGNFF